MPLYKVSTQKKGNPHNPGNPNGVVLCSDNADCPPGQACIAGLCQPCVSNANCALGEICHGGVCIPDPALPQFEVIEPVQIIPPPMQIIPQPVIPQIPLPQVVELIPQVSPFQLIPPSVITYTCGCCGQGFSTP